MELVCRRVLQRRMLVRLRPGGWGIGHYSCHAHLSNLIQQPHQLQLRLLMLATQLVPLRLASLGIGEIEHCTSRMICTLIRRRRRRYPGAAASVQVWLVTCVHMDDTARWACGRTDACPAAVAAAQHLWENQTPPPPSGTANDSSLMQMSFEQPLLIRPTSCGCLRRAGSAGRSASALRWAASSGAAGDKRRKSFSGRPG